MGLFPEKNETERIFRKMGFFTDQEGIRKRYSRERVHWQDHLDRTRQMIVKEASLHQPGKAAILGSGWLLDVPLQDLAGMFETVYLFDIFHPYEVRKSAERFTNVVFVRTDLSGLALPVYRWMKDKNKQFANFERLVPVLDFDPETFDFVVSCNLLDQIDIFLIDYISRRMIVTPRMAAEISAKIQDFHLHSLPPGKSLLICDIEELWISRDNSIARRENLFHSGVSLPGELDAWVWKFDNHARYNPGFNTWFTVKSFRI